MPGCVGGSNERWIAWRKNRAAGRSKLRGAADLWRLRVGDYRVVYQIRDAILVVLVIGCAIAARPTGEPSIER
jgi:mRNA-degrading endonuclease RelE of RelBE toxin-antitoxin system